MHGLCRMFGLFASCLLFAVMGCGAPPPPPGVSFSASALSRGADGKIKQDGEAITVAIAVVNDTAEVGNPDSAVSVRVRKTEYGKAIFEITFPDQSTLTIRIKAGDAKNILPKGQKVGVRIQVRESR
jgi:hypothetical protein